MKKFPIELIVAATPDGEIGYDNTIPWQLRGDLKRFKDLTMGHVLIMGRKTYESLPVSLRGRSIVVVSQSLMSQNNGNRQPPADFQSFVGGIGCKVQFAHSLMDALMVAMIDTVLNDQKIFIAGGAGIYDEALEMLQEHPQMELRVHLTTVYKEPHTGAYDTKIKNISLLDNFTVAADPIEVYDELYETHDEMTKRVGPQHLDPGGWYWPDSPKPILLSRTLSHTYTTLVRE